MSAFHRKEIIKSGNSPTDEIAIFIFLIYLKYCPLIVRVCIRSIPKLWLTSQSPKMPFWKAKYIS